MVPKVNPAMIITVAPLRKHPAAERSPRNIVVANRTNGCSLEIKETIIIIAWRLV
jgi:hypothetical protein